MSKPWDPDALFVKAKLFLNHAMDDESRQFDEQALWASLALELLAKAALAKVSPVLIAVPTEEGNSLLVACGLVEGDVRGSDSLSWPHHDGLGWLHLVGVSGGVTV